MVVINKINNYVVISSNNKRVLKAFDSIKLAKDFQKKNKISSYIFNLESNEVLA